METTDGCTALATSATVVTLASDAGLTIGLEITVWFPTAAVATKAPVTPPPTATAARASPATALRPVVHHGAAVPAAWEGKISVSPANLSGPPQRGW